MEYGFIIVMNFPEVLEFDSKLYAHCLLRKTTFFAFRHCMVIWYFTTYKGNCTSLIWKKVKLFSTILVYVILKELINVVTGTQKKGIRIIVNFIFASWRWNKNNFIRLSVISLILFEELNSREKENLAIDLKLKNMKKWKKNLKTLILNITEMSKDARLFLLHVGGIGSTFCPKNYRRT